MVQVDNNYDVIITIVTMGKKSLLSTIRNLTVNLRLSNGLCKDELFLNLIS